MESCSWVVGVLPPHAKHRQGVRGRGCCIFLGKQVRRASPSFFFSSQQHRIVAIGGPNKPLGSTAAFSGWTFLLCEMLDKLSQHALSCVTMLLIGLSKAWTAQRFRRSQRSFTMHISSHRLHSGIPANARHPRAQPDTPSEWTMHLGLHSEGNGPVCLIGHIGLENIKGKVKCKFTPSSTHCIIFQNAKKWSRGGGRVRVY